MFLFSGVQVTYEGSEVRVQAHHRKDPATVRFEPDHSQVANTPRHQEQCDHGQNIERDVDNIVTVLNEADDSWVVSALRIAAERSRNGRVTMKAALVPMILQPPDVSTTTSNLSDALNSKPRERMRDQVLREPPSSSRDQKDSPQCPISSKSPSDRT